MSRLKAMGEVRDPDGLASAVLADAVGYPGSSVAFAQLLSGMERSGLIEREVRGKRTYRIALAPGLAPDPCPAPGLAPRPAPGSASDAAVGVDYDELARRLLIEAVRRIAAVPGDTAPARDHDDLARIVASLERKLATAEARQRRLRAENARLRDLLAAARQSLAEQHLAAGDPGAYTGDPGRPDTGAVQLLERLLASLRGEESSGQSA
jgi:hypothetical protein